MSDGEASPQLKISDRSLVDRAKRNRQAFIELYRRHYDQVFRYCQHRLFDRSTAEDITAIVFVKAMENIYQFNGDDSKFGSWLFRIATNQINSYIKQNRRRNEILQDLSHTAPNCYTENDNSQNSQNLLNLKIAISKLKPDYQTVITLRYFEQMKSEDIADIVGCSAATARSRISRGLDKLRKLMNKHDNNKKLTNKVRKEVGLV